MTLNRHSTLPRGHIPNFDRFVSTCTCKNIPRKKTEETLGNWLIKNKNCNIDIKLGKIVEKDKKVCIPDLVPC